MRSPGIIALSSQSHAVTGTSVYSAVQELVAWQRLLTASLGNKLCQPVLHVCSNCHVHLNSGINVCAVSKLCSVLAESMLHGIASLQA